MTETVQTPDIDEAAPPSINLQDLQNVLQIIDISAERGTFKGAELSSVGSVRDKLAAFLQAAAQAEANAQAPDAEPEEAPKPARKGKRSSAAA